MTNQVNNTMPTDEEIEAITVAPRVRPEDIEARIVNEDFMFKGNLTICTLTLDNGFNVVGMSACVNRENFNEEMGRRISRSKAFDQLWAPMGMLLAERNFQQAQNKKAEANG